jgi:FixJ family two-component response regulator
MRKSNRRIAVVDDDKSVRKALMRLLETSSYDVRGFQSARELLSGLSDGHPECMIVDLQMPNMTGLELQQHLARTGIKIPTIVITAHDEPGTREQCIAAGAAAYLLKPIRKAALLTAIDQAIETST